jgi:hypothetical protein
MIKKNIIPLMLKDDVTFKGVGFESSYKLMLQLLCNTHILHYNLCNQSPQYGLRKKIICFVKNERSNLNTMTITLKSIVRCEILSLDKRFQCTCFDHIFKNNVNTL